MDNMKYDVKFDKSDKEEIFLEIIDKDTKAKMTFYLPSMDDDEVSNSLEVMVENAEVLFFTALESAFRKLGAEV